MSKRLTLFLVLSMIMAGMAFFLYLYINLQPRSKQGEEIPFSVEEGESLYSVLDRLESSGLIGDARIYKVYGKFFKTVAVKKGSYSLDPSLRGFDILSLLEEGRQELLRITIPEGLNSREIGLLLEKKGIATAESFRNAMTSEALLKEFSIQANSAEGYIFPDTYYFQKNYPAEKVLRHMISCFFEKLEEIFPFYEDLSYEKMQEKIILASIVEKEYRLDSEAPLIASVFNNRLKIGMPLQSCATVIYVLTEERGMPHPERVLFQDLEIQSPYNTYINKALPPGPISNPGTTAIAAAFKPAQSDYLFFVVKDKMAGTHTFSSSFSDHSSARADYIRGFRTK